MAIQPSAELLQAIRDYKNGRKDAFEYIYRASLSYLTKCVLTVLNRTAPGADDTLLQDILQDTYLTIAQKLNTLQTEIAFFQWAGQIATNYALRTGQKISYRQELEETDEDLQFDLPDERFIPEDILENQEKRMLIRKMLQELPTPQYLCLVEYFYNELKEREIAEKLDMPLGTVKTNLSRAKKKMKEIVQSHEKKNDVKLYSMSWLLMLLFLDDIKALFISEETARETYGAVTTQLSYEAAGTAGASAGAVGASAAGGVAAGFLAKVVAGVLAATMVVGGTIFAVRHFSNSAPEDERNAGESISTEFSYETEPSTVETTMQTQVITEEVTETTTQAQEEIKGDVVLKAEDLSYINQVAYCLYPGATEAEFLPYYREGLHFSYSVNSLIEACAGANGLLKGRVTDLGLEVSKADMETFLMDVLGWVPPLSVGSHEYYNIAQPNEDTYLLKRYRGDEEKPIKIHNLYAENKNTIVVIVNYYENAFRCVFERTEDSSYGWILTAKVPMEEKLMKNDVMYRLIYEKGVVLPADGAMALTSWNTFNGEISLEAATAYFRQYWLETTGELPTHMTAEEWGIWFNGYFTYKICINDSFGETQHCFTVGAPDSVIYRYDETTGTSEEIPWSLG